MFNLCRQPENLEGFDTGKPANIPNLRRLNSRKFGMFALLYGIIFSAMATRKTSTSKAKSSATNTTPEYREYEKRHRELGEDRPKLSPEEFEKLDDELLELLALDDSEMTDEQIVRIQELEYLLIDAE